MNILTVPEGSQIETNFTSQGIDIQWKNPDNLIYRFGLVAFMLFWLGGWISAETETAKKLWSAFQQGIPLEKFQIFWLFGWTVGGIFALTFLFRFLRCAGRTKLLLGINELTYKPSNPPITELLLNKTKQGGNPFVFIGEKTIKAKKQDINKLQLSYAGERLRLTFDIGAQRIEVGEYLTEPEKEWLHKTIENWL
jgi:hypothetical protein